MFCFCFLHFYTFLFRHSTTELNLVLYNVSKPYLSNLQKDRQRYHVYWMYIASISNNERHLATLSIQVLPHGHSAVYLLSHFIRSLPGYKRDQPDISSISLSYSQLGSTASWVIIECVSTDDVLITSGKNMFSKTSVREISQRHFTKCQRDSNKCCTQKYRMPDICQTRWNTFANTGVKLYAVRRYNIFPL